MSGTEVKAEKQRVEPEALPSYTVDALVEKLAVSANVKIWKTLDSIIRIQGIVKKIKNRYANVQYFELRGGSTTVSVKCPVELCPAEGDNIVVEGIVTMKPSRFSPGLDLVIDGKPVASLSLPQTQIQKGYPFYLIT